MTIKEFNIEEALNGASIGFVKITEVDQYIIDFKRSNTGKASSEYVGIGQDDNKKYYFNSSGLCADGDLLHSLYRLEEEINTDERGTVASRGDAAGGTEEISIDNLQPREQFALAAMQTILGKLDIPILGIDNFKITRVCDLSFKIAQQMMSTAAEYRAATKEPEIPEEGEEVEDLEIDINSITNVRDKILYNMYNNIKVIKEDNKIVSENSTKELEQTTIIATKTSDISNSIKEISNDTESIANSQVQMVQKLENISNNTLSIANTTADILEEVETINNNGVKVNNTVNVTGSVDTFEQTNVDVTVTNMPGTLTNPMVTSVINTPSVNVSNTPAVTISGQPISVKQTTTTT